ncbi:MAG: hypothetical protein M3Z31_00045 [Pseudomonadota bacterium]|nr:hypothetical protein [Pseudomonadota bacterium]
MRAIAVVLALALLPARAALAIDTTTDVSDLWWSAAESGWGLQLTQTGDIVFATLYVYDSASVPTFFVATLGRIARVAEGDLFRTTGPSFAATPFDPGLVRGSRVGAMTFTLLDDTSATLEYSVSGIAVRKQVTRQPLRLDDYNGRFPAMISRVSGNCPTSGLDRTRNGPATLTFVQAGPAMSLEWIDPDGVTCAYRGVYDQRGKLGSLEASYVCSNSEEGNAAFSLRVVDGFISGRLRAHGINNGCDHAASFATVNPR